MYRRSQKDLKDNLDNIPSIPQEVRDLFQVSLLYEQEPTEKNFKAMHSKVVMMQAEHIKTSARLFLEMLQHANLVERNHRVRRWREYKRGDRSMKGNSLTIQDCFKDLMAKGFSPESIRENLLRQNTELVFTAHPTQAARRSIINKHAAISNLLETHDFSKQLTPLQKTELLAELQENLLGIWRTNPVRRHKPSPEDEARYGLSVVEDALWHALPDHYHTVDKALVGIGQPTLPVDCCLLTIGSWMGGDRDGNPYVTSKLTKRVVFLSQWRAAHLYWQEVGELMWDLSIANSCSSEIEDELERLAGLANKQRGNLTPRGVAKKRSESHAALQAMIAPSDFYNPQQEGCEPYRLVLQQVRKRLGETVKKAKALSQDLPWKSPEPDALSPPYNKTAELAEDLMRIYRSLHESGDGIIAEARLKKLLWRVHTFGLSLTRLDIRQESTRHTDVLNELCRFRVLVLVLESFPRSSILASSLKFSPLCCLSACDLVHGPLAVSALLSCIQTLEHTKAFFAARLRVEGGLEQGLTSTAWKQLPRPRVVSDMGREHQSAVADERAALEASADPALVQGGGSLG